MDITFFELKSYVINISAIQWIKVERGGGVWVSVAGLEEPMLITGPEEMVLRQYIKPRLLDSKSVSTALVRSLAGLHP